MDGRVSRSARNASIDLLFAFPGLLLAILATAVFGPSLQTVALALAISYIPYTARVVRSEAMRQRHLPVHRVGVGARPAVRLASSAKHLLPSLLPLIIAQTTVSFGYATIDVAALSYLGLGVQPPTADWGTMVADRSDEYRRRATRSSPSMRVPAW